MWATVASQRKLGLLAAVAVVLAWATAVRAEGDVRVTVIAILASNRHTKIDPKLKCLADKLRETEPMLTGFATGRMTTKVIAPGSEATFPLVEDQTATVILEPKPKKGKGTCVTVKTPGVGTVTYTIKCEKCFPIATPYQTKKGDRLIVGFIVEAIEVKEPPPKKP